MVKKIICIVLMILLLIPIGVSQYLLSIKPDTSKVTTDQKIAAYIKPAVVRVVEGYDITWRYTPPDGSYYEIDDIIYSYLDKIGSQTGGFWSGTGAIINSDGYIVTNAHVVDLYKIDDAKLIDDDLQYISKALAKQFNVGFDVMYGYAKACIKATNVTKVFKVVLPGGEIVDFDVKSYGAPVGEGKDVAVIKIEKKNLPSIALGNSSTVNLQDSIWVFGYPGAADSGLLSDDSILVVSITNGKVSATDKKSTQGAPVLQIDAAASNGNSGGPLINSAGEIVGLLTFRSENNTTATQGFNFAVPVDTVKEFVSQAGAKNEEGAVNKLYKEGLTLYWGGYYKDALNDFVAVQRLYPAHSEINRLIADCQAKSSLSKTLWSNYKQTFLIVDIACVVLIVILLAVLILSFVKPKNKPQPVEQAQIPVNNNPVNYNTQNNSPIHNNSPNNYNENPINQTPQPIQTNTVEVNQKGPELCCLSGPLKDLIVKVAAEPVVFGRDQRTCGVLFPSNYVQIARKHCSLYYDFEKQLFVLEDHASSSGTFLSTGERLNPNEKVYIKAGDSFYLATTDNLFEVWSET